MKKRLCGILSVLAVLLMMGMTVCAVDAGNIKKNSVLQTNSEVELRETPDENSAVTAALLGGTPVIIKEDAADGWCKAAYQEKEGYVQISYLVLLGTPIAPEASGDQDTAAAEPQPTDSATAPQPADTAAEPQPTDGATAPQPAEPQPADIATAPQAADDAVRPDRDALDDEFKTIEEAAIVAYQEAETAKDQAASEKVWGIVIAVLVVAIFAVGIITTLRNNKGKK